MNILSQPDAFKKEIDRKYRDLVERLILVRFQVTFSIGFFLYLGFNVFDRILYPAHGPYFLKIRIISSCVTLIIFSLSFFKTFKAYAPWFIEISYSILIISVVYMVYLTDGSSSTYYQGINLCYFAIGFVNAFYFARNLLNILFLIILYNLAMFASHSPFNSLNFYFANYFMMTTAIIVGLTSKFYSDQHYMTFVQQEQLRINVEDLKQAQDELARSNRELEQFAYIASHDLQEPLRMVASFCQKLENRYKDKLDESANEYIHFAVDGAKRMQLLVDALLSYARAGKKDVPVQEVDLNKVLQTILHDLDAVIKDNGAVIQVGQLPVIMANQIQMSQLFQNFLTNALKFKGERKPVVEVSARKEQGEWEFTVSDNGIGIAEKHFAKIFVIFNRIHQRGNYPGTGIGLALCKKIIENYNGKIQVTSQLGEGTAFYFTLNVKEA
jgi:signal transduction histidine kinase